jgi:hypothetical protein
VLRLDQQFSPKVVNHGEKKPTSKEDDRRAHHSLAQLGCGAFDRNLSEVFPAQLGSRLPH